MQTFVLKEESCQTTLKDAPETSFVLRVGIMVPSKLMKVCASRRKA